MSEFVVSVDLGQANDYTAAMVFEVIRDGKACNLHLRHIERLELGTTYPKIVDYIEKLVNSEQLRGGAKRVVIDVTGCGRPVWDMLRETKLRAYLYGVLIHGGDNVTKENGVYRVPKRDLISSLQIVFQNNKLKIARGLPGADTLVKELINFKVKINTNGHDQYEAWRESIHDDLVLSAAMGVWLATQNKPFNLHVLAS